MVYYSGKLIVLKKTYDTQYSIYGHALTTHYNYFLDFEKNNNFVAILADSNSSRDKGKIQISTSNGFFVVNLENKVLYDKYTSFIKGRANEFLEQVDIVDLTVGLR